RQQGRLAVRSPPTGGRPPPREGHQRTHTQREEEISLVVSGKSCVSAPTGVRLPCRLAAVGREIPLDTAAQRHPCTIIGPGGQDLFPARGRRRDGALTRPSPASAHRLLAEGCAPVPARPALLVCASACLGPAARGYRMDL